MKRVRCPKCDNFITFDETKYQAGQSLVFVCPNCNKQFGIRMGVTRLRDTQKEENPDELANEEGWVTGCKCIRMELGEPDASGRRSPVEVPGSEFTIDCDAVIMSLGTSPNPLIKTTTAGLEVNKRGGIIVNESEMTTREGVFAGGDAVTGAATVILAMGAGKSAAKGIDEYLSRN